MEAFDTLQIIKALSALALVLGLIVGLSTLIKKFGFAEAMRQSKSKRRLKLIESLHLDAKRRLVIVACDDKQHLVLLGANSDTVIQHEIKPVPDDEPIS